MTAPPGSIATSRRAPVTPRSDPSSSWRSASGEPAVAASRHSVVPSGAIPRAWTRSGGPGTSSSTVQLPSSAPRKSTISQPGSPDSGSTHTGSRRLPSASTRTAAWRPLPSSATPRTQTAPPESVRTRLAAGCSGPPLSEAMLESRTGTRRRGSGPSGAHGMVASGAGRGYHAGGPNVTTVACFFVSIALTRASIVVSLTLSGVPAATPLPLPGRS